MLMLGTGLTKAKIMAMVADLCNRSLFRQQPPPQPPPQPRRSNSPSGVHYPRHFTNSATYFAHTSGCGPRESLRRRSGGFARVRRDAAALQSFLNA